jgi:hypothetical protein
MTLLEPFYKHSEAKGPEAFRMRHVDHFAMMTGDRASIFPLGKT